MSVISPGEPFHTIKADHNWLLNWYFVQDYGITLFGPPPRTFIDPISKDEFIRAVVHHAHQWPKSMPKTRHYRSYQSYAILTMCRSLYTYTHGEQVSKKQAAHWAQKGCPNTPPSSNPPWNGVSPPVSQALSTTNPPTPKPAASSTTSAPSYLNSENLCEPQRLCGYALTFYVLTSSSAYPIASSISIPIPSCHALPNASSPSRARACSIARS